MSNEQGPIVKETEKGLDVSNHVYKHEDLAHSHDARFFVSLRNFIARSHANAKSQIGLTQWLLHHDSLTIAVECLNLDWHCLLHHSICYFFRS